MSSDNNNNNYGTEEQLPFYLDEQRTQRIEKFEFPRTEIGKSPTITFYIHNPDSKYPFEVKSFDIPKDTRLMDEPMTISPDETRAVRLQWNPTLSVREPLNSEIVLTGAWIIG